MLEQGETTALRQRSCTTKLQTVTKKKKQGRNWEICNLIACRLRTSHDFLPLLLFFSLSFSFLIWNKEKRENCFLLRKILLSSDRLMKCFSSTLDKYFTCKFFLNWFNLYCYNYREIFYQIARGHCNAKSKRDDCKMELWHFGDILKIENRHNG